MTTYTRLTVPGVVIFSTLGSTIGALVLYWAGTALSPQRLDTLMKGRAFKWLGFEREDMEKTVQWFDKHGKKAILLGRCVCTGRHGTNQHPPVSHIYDNWKYGLEYPARVPGSGSGSFLGNGFDIYRKIFGIYQGCIGCDGSVLCNPSCEKENQLTKILMVKLLSNFFSTFKIGVIIARYEKKENVSEIRR